MRTETGLLIKPIISITIFTLAVAVLAAIEILKTV